MKNACEFIIVSVILNPGLHYTARHLLIRDQKTPTPILYIKSSTVDDKYYPTQLFHQVISSADKKQSGIERFLPKICDIEKLC